MVVAEDDRHDLVGHVRTAGEHGLGQAAVTPGQIDGDVAAGAQPERVPLGPGSGKSRQQADAIAVTMEQHLGDGGGGAKIAVDLEGWVVVPEVVQGRAPQDGDEVFIGTVSVRQASEHSDGPGPAPAGAGAALAESTFDRLHDRVPHGRIAIEIDLVAGVGADHMRHVAVPRFGLFERQAPLHQAAVFRDLGAIHLG